jgi:hypothetical protein
MQYKTIVLELIQQQAELHERLRGNRTLLTTVDRLAGLLRNRHEAWISQLHQSRPGTGQQQLASEALELALEELESILPTGSEADEREGLSLDEAMQFLRNRQPQN